MWARLDDISEIGRRSLSKRKNISYYIFLFPVAARPKRRACNRSLAETAGSNLNVEMNICLLCVLCPQVQVLSMDKRSPTLCGTSECDCEASERRRPCSASECRPCKKERKTRNNISTLCAVKCSGSAQRITFK